MNKKVLKINVNRVMSRNIFLFQDRLSLMFWLLSSERSDKETGAEVMEKRQRQMEQKEIEQWVIKK